MMARYEAPTAFDAVTPEVTVAREQTCGPAATILQRHDTAEAARVANGTSDLPLPIGSAKESQHGREIGVLGAREFTDPKTVRTGPTRL
jgi:succinate-semialdehyde dehydrogenase/glutarate-semialdehyde dehydrogenase